MTKKILLLPDIHYPYQNKPSIRAVSRFIKWFRPKAVALTGDSMDMASLSWWEKHRGNKKYFEGKRLMKEYWGFDGDILTPLEKLLPRNTERIYMKGNHEYRVEEMINTTPQLDGLIGLEEGIHLRQRGWEVTPYFYKDKNGNTKIGTVQFGKLVVMHGIYTNKYNAAKTASIMHKSVAYCHTHSVQMFTQSSMNADDLHIAVSIGCLANKAPDYLKGKPNNWVNAFGILYVWDGGNFNLYVPIITNGHFVYAGKKF